MLDAEHLPPEKPYPHGHPDLDDTSEVGSSQWLVDKIDGHIINCDKDFAAVQLRLGDYEGHIFGVMKVARELSKCLVCTNQSLRLEGIQ